MFVRYSTMNLFRRKARTLYAMIGIAIALSVVVAIVSATHGVREGIVNMLKQFRGDLLIYDRKEMSVGSSELPESLLGELETIEGIRQINPYALRVFAMNVKGLDETTFRALQMFSPAELRQIEAPRVPVLALGYPENAFIFDRLKAVEGVGQFSSPTANEMLVGVQARNLAHGYIENFFDRLPNGAALRDRVMENFFDPQFKMPRPVLNGEEFKIVGIFETDSYMDGQVIVPLKTMQRITGRLGLVNGFLVRADSDSAIEKIKDRVAQISVQIPLQRPQTAPIDTPPGMADDEPMFRTVQLVAKQAEEMVGSFGNEFERVEQMILAIAFLAGIGGAVSVLNTMASNVHERTREIGLLRAVGWSRRRMIVAILFEGCLIALIGGIVGCLLGVLELEIVERIIGYSPVPQGYQPIVFFQAMLIALVLGLFGSLLPAWRASRLSPVEALREE